MKSIENEKLNKYQDLAKKNTKKVVEYEGDNRTHNYCRDLEWFFLETLPKKQKKNMEI